MQAFTFDRRLVYIAVFHINIDILHIIVEFAAVVISSGQMKAARALLGWDQRRLAKAAGVSLPTVQRMESSEGNVRGNVDSLVKIVEALAHAGVTLIAAGAISDSGGRGVRLTD